MLDRQFLWTRRVVRKPGVRTLIVLYSSNLRRIFLIRLLCEHLKLYPDIAVLLFLNMQGTWGSRSLWILRIFGLFILLLNSFCGSELHLDMIYLILDVLLRTFILLLRQVYYRNVFLRPILIVTNFFSGSARRLWVKPGHAIRGWLHSSERHILHSLLLYRHGSARGAALTRSINIEVRWSELTAGWVFSILLGLLG